MSTLTIVVISTVGALVGLPVLAYLIAKFGSTGYFKAREFFERNRRS